MKTRMRLELHTPSDAADGIIVSVAGCFTSSNQFEEIMKTAHFLADAFTEPQHPPSTGPRTLHNTHTDRLEPSSAKS